MLILIITHEFCPIFLLKQTVKVIKTVSNPHGLRLAVDMKFRIHIRIHIHDFTWISMDISISMDASIFCIRELPRADKNFSPLQPSPLFLSLSPLHHHRVGSIPAPSPWYKIFLTQPTSHQLVLFSSGRMFAWHLSFTWHQIQLVHSLQYCTTVSGAARILWQGGSEVWVYSGSRVRSPPVPVVLSVYQRGFFARRPCNVLVVWYEEVPWQWKHTHIT